MSFPSSVPFLLLNEADSENCVVNNTDLLYDKAKEIKNPVLQ